MSYTPNSYTTTGTETTFAITFPFLKEADVVVTVFDPSGNTVSAFDYEIFLDGSFKARVVADGTITDNTPTPLTSGHTVTISRATDIATLATTFQDGVSLRADDINLLLNQQNFALQEFGRNTEEALGKNVNDTAWDAKNLRVTNLATPTADNDALRKVDLDSGIGTDITTVASIAANVTSVAADAADIGVVAANLSGSDTIGTVAGSIANVDNVGGAIANVNAVAGDAVDIGAVAADLSGSNTIGTVAGIASAVSSVAADAADIGVVATDLSGSDTIGTVAGISAAVSNVSSISAAVTSVNGNSTNINTVAGDTSAINTLATGTDSGGTAYLTHLENASTNAAAAQAALTAFNRTYLGAYSADPTVDGNGDALTDGDLYYNTTDEVLKFYNDTDDVWVTLSNSVQVNAATTLGAVGDANFGTLLENDFIVRDGSNPAKWVNKTPAQARTSLGLGTAAVAATGDFATATQGGLADTAVQPADLATVATSGLYSDLSGSPTLATVATSGSYNDLANLPTLGTAAAAATGDFATATQGGKADTALQPSTSADFGSNRILYSNMWDTSSETLPSASTYHGMFLHDHHTGLGYFAHAGSWQALQNEITTSTALAAGSITTVTDAGNTVDVRRADRIALAASANADGGATLYDATATATLTLSDLVAGDIVTVFSRSGTTTVARGTIANLYIDGDIASNKTSVTVGGGTLATITMVSNNTAVIAGSDLT